MADELVGSGSRRQNWQQIAIEQGIIWPASASELFFSLPAPLQVPNDCDDDELTVFTARHIIGAFRAYYPKLYRSPHGIEKIDDVRKKERDIFLIAGMFFRQYHFAPAAYAAFSIFVWTAYAHIYDKPPPFAHAFNGEKMYERRGWFHHSSFYDLSKGQRLLSYGHEYHMHWRALCVQVERNPLQAKELVASARQPLHHLREKAIAQKEEQLAHLSRRVSLGEFIWKR